MDFISEDNSYLCLLGDFSARSGTLSDFTELNKDISDNFLDYDSKFTLSKNNLLELGFPINRHSKDFQTNNFGFRLIDICRAFDIHIANGRCGLDAYVGNTTCKGVSLVDYLILSPELFPLVSKFEILDFDPLISDVHNAVSFDIIQKDFICLPTSNTASCNHEDQSYTRATWNANFVTEFKNKITLEQILHLSNDLDLF